MLKENVPQASNTSLQVALWGGSAYKWENIVINSIKQTSTRGSEFLIWNSTEATEEGNIFTLHEKISLCLP